MGGMTHTEAEQLLGLLVGGTSGWTNADDETFVIYTRQIATLADTDIAERAVEHVIRTWEQARRPPIAELFNAYRTIMTRDAMTRPALPPAPGSLIGLAEGRRIAARAYAAECERRPADDPLIASGFRSRNPSSRTLDSLLGIIATDPGRS